MRDGCCPQLGRGTLHATFVGGGCCAQTHAAPNFVVEFHQPLLNFLFHLPLNFHSTSFGILSDFAAFAFRPQKLFQIQSVVDVTWSGVYPQQLRGR